MARLTCNFLSYTLHRAVDITVVIPTVCFPEMETRPSHRLTAPFPVLYLLHGYGNNHATWTGYTNAERYAEERNIALVMISADNRFYLDHGGDDNYYTFLTGELPEFVQSMFPVSADPRENYIAGLSMGGFGALMIGLHNSDRFRAIGAFSAATDEVRADRFADAVPASILEGARACAATGRRLPVYLACGDRDFLFARNEEFRDRLLDLGFDVTWCAAPGMDHEWRFWDEQIERFLDWIPRGDAHDPRGHLRKI